MKLLQRSALLPSMTALLISMLVAACQPGSTTVDETNGMSADIASTLQEIGAVIEVPRTTALYTPYYGPDDFAEKNVNRDIPYGTHERHVLDIFTTQADLADAKPVVVFIHGGGFARGAKSTPDSPFYDNIMNWAVDNDMVGVNINYRLAPEFQWPAGIEDVGRVISWLQNNIQDYGGDPDKVFLWGHSAGGAHVADYLAWMATNKQNDFIAGAILTSPVILHGDSTLWTAYYGENPALYAVRSPLEGLAQSTTPLFLNSAELDRDNFKEDAQQVRNVLDAAGKEYRYLYLPGHSHISETYAVGSPDESLSGPVKEFIMKVSTM